MIFGSKVLSSFSMSTIYSFSSNNATDRHRQVVWT